MGETLHDCVKEALKGERFKNSYFNPDEGLCVGRIYEIKDVFLGYAGDSKIPVIDIKSGKKHELHMNYHSQDLRVLKGNSSKLSEPAN